VIARPGALCAGAALARVALCDTVSRPIPQARRRSCLASEPIRLEMVRHRGSDEVWRIRPYGQQWRATRTTVVPHRFSATIATTLHLFSAMTAKHRHKSVSRRSFSALYPNDDKCIFVICLSVFEFDAAAFADACLDSSGSSVVPVCIKVVESPATERDDLVAEQLDWKALV